VSWGRGGTRLRFLADSVSVPVHGSVSENPNGVQSLSPGLRRPCRGYPGLAPPNQPFVFSSLRARRRRARREERTKQILLPFTQGSSFLRLRSAPARGLATLGWMIEPLRGLQTVNAERSHAEPTALEWNRDAKLALADAQWLGSSGFLYVRDDMVGHHRIIGVRISNKNHGTAISASARKLASRYVVEPVIPWLDVRSLKANRPSHHGLDPALGNVPLGIPRPVAYRQDTA
jgi:hypothetical protein